MAISNESLVLTNSGVASAFAVSNELQGTLDESAKTFAISNSGQTADLFIPGSSAGPISDAALSADPTDSLGPVFDHNAASVPLSSLGPVTDEAISHSSLDSVGTVFDHQVQEIPAESTGPADDTYLGFPDPVIHGPVFDHVVQFFGAIPALGPVEDRYLSPANSAHGPVFEHIVEGQPGFLPVRTPESVTPPELPRERIKPQPVEVLSPGIYGLEKDEDGDVTGFKF